MTDINELFYGDNQPDRRWFGLSALMGEEEYEQFKQDCKDDPDADYEGDAMQVLMRDEQYESAGTIKWARHIDFIDNGKVVCGMSTVEVTPQDGDVFKGVSLFDDEMTISMVRRSLLDMADRLKKYEDEKP